MKFSNLQESRKSLFDKNKIKNNDNKTNIKNISTQKEKVSVITQSENDKKKVNFYDFCKFMDNLKDPILFEKYEQKILDQNNPKLSYKFCYNVKNATLRKHSNIIINSQDEGSILGMLDLWFWEKYRHERCQSFKLAPYCQHFRKIVMEDKLDDFFEKYSRVGQLLSGLIFETNLKQDTAFVEKVAKYYFDKKQYDIAAVGAFVPGFMEEYLPKILNEIKKTKKTSLKDKVDMYKELLDTLHETKISQNFIDQTFEYIAKNQNSDFITELLDRISARPQSEIAIKSIIKDHTTKDERKAREFIWAYLRLCDTEDEKQNLFKVPAFKKVYDVIVRDCKANSSIENIISWIGKNYDTHELVDKLIKNKDLHYLLHSTITHVQPHLVPKVQKAILDLIYKEYQQNPETAGYDLDHMFDTKIIKIIDTQMLSEAILKIGDPDRSARFVFNFPETKDYDKHFALVQTTEDEDKRAWRIKEMQTRREKYEKEKSFINVNKDDISKIETNDIEFVM